MSPSVRVYECPGGSGIRSLFPDLRDCPVVDAGAIELGKSIRPATRFLGAHGTVIPLEEYQAQFAGVAASKPEPVNTRKLLGIALGVFAILALIILARRRKR